MKPNRFLTIFSYILLAALLVLTPILTPRSATAAEVQHDSIVGNVVWSSSRGIGTDTVVENGTTLTIKSGVTIGVETTLPDPAPYPGGRSNKIEIIVESGGTLNIEPGVTIAAANHGDWYGVVFLPGSSGTIDGATIRNGTVGVTIRESSPTIKNSTIGDMWGSDGDISNVDGELAAGVYIIGPSTSQVISNTIENIVAGYGMDGQDGLESNTPGEKGGNGGHGANGGPAFGIYIFGDAAPTIKDNVISEVYGGGGGDGGKGGNGAAGWQFFPQDGSSGGNGGNGGLGGNAYGISVNSTGAGFSITNNTFHHIYGGESGYGGDGGQGGAGVEKTDLAGGAGGQGGDGGDSNYAGDVTGIDADGNKITVQDNWVYSLLGGDSGDGGKGGNGGKGAAGSDAGVGQAYPGGDGGNGGAGGNASYAGDAVGIDLYLGGGLPLRADPNAAVPTMISGNIVSDSISPGHGGDGGDGGMGGAGGDGGDGDIGGYAGIGGYGGTGGYGYNSGFAAGMYIETDGFVHIFRNRITEVEGHNAGDGGDGGDGGAGGTGGDSGLAATPGGSGGIGGAGGHGGWGGEVNYIDGLYLDAPARVQNNLVAINSGNMGGDGGAGGAGGVGGDGGSGTPDGIDAKGGSGGNGGDGGNYGPGEVLYVDVDGNENVELVNNTLVDMHGESSVGEGGLAGSGGSGPGGTGNNGTPGSDGTDGDDSCGLCLDTDAQLFIINNIIYHTEISEPATPANSTAYGIYSDQPTTISLDYNNLYGWDQNYFDVSAGPHDSLLDPLFLDVDDDDYHLTSHSPCIDKGTSTFTGLTLPADDLDGVTRPQGSSHDMGAYESLSIRYIYLPLILR
jgi:hypothetical protein